MSRIVPLIVAALSLILDTPALAQTVILVRHAEKADQSADPVLSDPGVDRAQALAVALSDADLTHILVTPLRRTAQTADLTARAHAITPEAIALDGTVAAHVDRVVERIHSLPPSAVVLVVGHSNTIPPIAAALGQTGPGAMADCEYDRLTVLQVRSENGYAPTVVSRYGPPSACE